MSRLPVSKGGCEAEGIGHVGQQDVGVDHVDFDSAQSRQKGLITKGREIGKNENPKRILCLSLGTLLECLFFDFDFSKVGYRPSSRNLLRSRQTDQHHHLHFQSAPVHGCSIHLLIFSCNCGTG